MTQSMEQVTWVGREGSCSEIQAVIKPPLFNDHINKAGIPLLGVRDYIHVVDLAKGHIAALKKLKENCGCKVSQSQIGVCSLISWLAVCVHVIEVFLGRCSIAGL